MIEYWIKYTLTGLIKDALFEMILNYVKLTHIIIKRFFILLPQIAILEKSSYNNSLI